LKSNDKFDGVFFYSLLISNTVRNDKMICKKYSFHQNLLLIHNFYYLTLITQLQGGLVILQQQHAIPVRAFAKEAARPTFKGDG
jgi:hypothetical protein